MSRRGFLGASSVAAAAGLIQASRSLAAQEGDMGEYIDVASFRPRPDVRIVGAIVRLQPPYWLGWPGTAYDLEARRKEYRDAADVAAERVGVKLAQKGEPLESEAAVKEFAAKLKESKPDAVLLILQHLNVWPWAEIIADTGIPTIIFAPVGTAFTGHVLHISRRPGVHVISSLETSALEQAFRMIRARRQLEETRVLVVAGDKEYEKTFGALGTTLHYIPRKSLHQLFARMPENDEARDLASTMRRRAKNIVEPTQVDLLNAARSFTTAKRLLRDHSANAITSDCLGMVTARVVPTPPCMAASLFQDAGVTYGCEADIGAALSLLLVSYLFDRPGFQNDPVPETVKNVLIAAHCTCGTRLNGFNAAPEPFILRSHSESDIGVAMQVLWREGQPVTLVRFQNPKELILDTGTIVGNVQTPPAGGCRTSIEIAMDRVEDSRDVLGFHQAVFYGSHRREVEAFCQTYGIRVINSPEKAPKPAQA
jgi:hypothetical protein